MPRPETGNLQSLMRGLTIGTVKQINAAKAKRSLEALAEREDQYKVSVSGRAEEFASWTETHISFDTLFVDATGQRDSDFEHPIFNYGAYVPVGGPIGLLACVTRWDVNDRNETTGCILAIGAVATDQARKFRGEVHARFQGFGMPKHSYGDMESIDVN